MFSDFSSFNKRILDYSYDVKLIEICEVFTAH